MDKKNVHFEKFFLWKYLFFATENRHFWILNTKNLICQNIRGLNRVKHIIKLFFLDQYKFIRPRNFIDSPGNKMAYQNIIFIKFNCVALGSKIDIL